MKMALNMLVTPSPPLMITAMRFGFSMVMEFKYGKMAISMKVVGMKA